MKTKNVTEKNMKVCLVGSSGGHLTHSNLQKSAITHHSISPINTPIKALYNPIITHPEERIWAGRTPPAAAPGPGRSEDQARQDETILHD